MEYNKTPKKRFQMPHILWILFGLLILAALLTYIIPAGNFATDGQGNIIASEFNFLEEQTPVSFFDMMMLILEGMTSQASIMVLVLTIGANIAILLETNAIDNILNATVYYLRDSGQTIAIVTLFVIMTYIGGFAGSDALLAMVPIGVAFSKKFKLDPIVAMGLTTFPAMIGFSTGPTTPWIAQSIMGVTPYSGFLLRFVLMNFFLIVGLFYLLRYIRKIKKDPQNSVMYIEGWRPGEDANSAEQKIKSERLKFSSILTLLLFLGQYIFIIGYSVSGGEDTFAFIIAANLITAVLIGLVNRMNFDHLGDTFAKGVNQMGFIVFLIGLAGAFSLVLSEGNITDTIVYTLTRPLMDIGRGLSNIGIALIVAVMELFIPSSASKVAIVAPIITPIAEALDVTGQTAVHAYQIGDRWPNLISPVLGWTIGSLVAAKVPYNRWLKWVFPIFVVFMVLSLIILYFLTIFNWTGM